jgi:N-acetylglucosamine malate deacetylase 2
MALFTAVRTLTGIYAHPDDETFSGGGTYARYSAQGVVCTLFSATNGDAGKSTVAVASREELGALRRTELAKAAGILGFRTVELPGHPDGALGAVDQDLLISQIVRHLRRARSQVVITFGPEGAPNTHRDHRAISRAATAAFFLAGNPTMFTDQLSEVEPHAPARLYYVTWPAPTAGAELKTHGVAATARIDVREFLEREAEAWAAHATQQGLQQRFAELAATNEELFGLAAGVPQPASLVDDLFAGL